MVTSEPPVSSLMRIKSLFSSWDGLDTYSLPIGQIKKKKTCVSKCPQRLELGTQSSLWSSQPMPTGEIQPEVFIPWTAPCIGSTVPPCTFAEMLKGCCACISISIYPYRNQILKHLIILGLQHKAKQFAWILCELSFLVVETH